MIKITCFEAKMFASTEHTSSKEKAEFANRLASFVINGFQLGHFTNIIYNHLNHCFGHIAHYNRDGFYAVWFASPEQQSKFIRHVLEHKSVGSSKYTFSDVEAAFQAWLVKQNIKLAIKPVNEQLYVALEDTASHMLTILVSEHTVEEISTVVDQTMTFIGKFANDTFDIERVKAVKSKLNCKFVKS